MLACYMLHAVQKKTLDRTFSWVVAVEVEPPRRRVWMFVEEVGGNTIGDLLTPTLHCSARLSLDHHGDDPWSIRYVPGDKHGNVS